MADATDTSASAVPALPPGFKLDAVPALPPGFKLDPAGPVATAAGAAAATPQPAMSSKMSALLGKKQVPTNEVPHAPPAFQGDMGGGEPGYVDPWGAFATGAGVMSGGSAVAGAGKALLSGAYKPAIGLAAGLGTGFAADKAAKALGAPPWVADIVAGIAGVAVGEKVGMSPELLAKLRSGGLKGVVNEWINGPPKPSNVIAFFKEKYGRMPNPGEEMARAEAEAAYFKQQIKAKLKAADAGPEPFKPFRADPNVIKTKYPGPKKDSYSPPSRSVSPKVKPSERVFKPVEEPEAEAAEGAAVAETAKPKDKLAVKIEAGRPGAPGAPGARIRAFSGETPAARSGAVTATDSETMAQGRNVMAQRDQATARVGQKLKGRFTPDQIRKMTKPELEAAAGEKFGEPSIDKATGQVKKNSRTHELRRDQIARWLELNGQKQ